TLVDTSPLCVDPTAEMQEAYWKSLGQLSRFKESPSCKVCYTPMHGVGLEFATKAVSTLGLQPMVVVPEQAKPDPEFPTVAFPNPEEKGALDLAMKHATQSGCTLIFANDPDADRFACAEWQETTKRWQVFSGNQLGVLLASFVLEGMRDRDGRLDPSLAVLTTAVSSHMLQELAKVEGIHFDETLTGFKWLGNRAIELEQEGKKVVFAFEEAIGFMCGRMVRDKDGVSALAVFYEWANHLYAQGKTVAKYLDTLYSKYGCWVSNNAYYICHDAALTRAIFNKIRYGSSTATDDAPLAFPKTLGGVPVVYVRDLTIGYDS
ncbi:Phosphoglucomutase-3, partial [Kappamyces sp. JEL0680]